MNDVCELWSQPWHALQRNLASRLMGDAAAPLTATLKAVNLQIGAVNADSWLGRARLRPAPGFPVRP
jgi:hypothetical protein